MQGIKIFQNRLLMIPGDEAEVIGYYASGMTVYLRQRDADDAVITKDIAPEVMKVFSYGAAQAANGYSGTDPEIFVFDKDGQVIPSWLFLPKQNEKKGHPIYSDGVQAELNTPREYCHAFLTDKVQSRLRGILVAARKHDLGARLLCEDVVKVPPTTLATADITNVELGCAPSLNIYAKYKPKQIPEPRALKYRFSGCHQHFSTASNQLKPSWFPHGTVRMLDRITGPFFTALGRDLENPIRRKYYGRPGEYRLPDNKNNRLEYRTPGSFLLRSPAIFNLAMDVSRYAYKLGLYMDGALCPIPDSTSAVYNCDADKAVEILKNHKEYYMAMLESIYSNRNSVAQKTFDVALHGLKASGLTDKSVEDAWDLNHCNWVSHNNDDQDGWGRTVRSTPYPKILTT